jgi:hypothetical protein
MLDSGTVEHVFNIGNAIRNAVGMVKVGGRAIFLSPAAGYMDHGFYTLSPGLFFDFFTANGWRIDTLNLIRHSFEIRGRFRAYAYKPETSRALTSGPNALPYLVLAVATRLPASTTNNVPQQRRWVDTWDGRDIDKRTGRRQELINALSSIPGFTRMVFPIWGTIKSAYVRHQQWVGDF